MESNLEVALILANCAPYNGRYIYWVLSRKQIEYILTDLEKRGEDKTAHTGVYGQYLEELLPVISLERYFGLKVRKTRLADKFIVTRTAGENGKLAKIIVQAPFPVRMRNLDFKTAPTDDNGLLKNSEDILGCFHQGTKHIFIVPDLAVILEKCR